MTADQSPDIRCDNCREMGVECPNGYYSDYVACYVCGAEHIAVMPNCVEDPVECAACGCMSARRTEKRWT